MKPSDGLSHFQAGGEWLAGLVYSEKDEIRLYLPVFPFGNVLPGTPLKAIFDHH
jgi:hypothetical protein